MGQLKKMVIVDTQTEYGFRMADWLQSHYKQQVICFVLRDIDELKDLMIKQSVDVILIDGELEKEYEDSCDKYEIFVNIKEKIWWLQNYTSLKKRDVCRYQSMKALVGHIQLFDEFVNDSGSNRAKTAEDTVYNVAMIPVMDSLLLRDWVRHYIEVQGSRKLLWYICMENDVEYLDVSEQILYAIKMKNATMLNELGVIDSLMTVSSIAPVRYPYDYRELGEEEFQWLFDLANGHDASCYAYINLGLLRDEQVVQCFDEIWLLCDEENNDFVTSVAQFLESDNSRCNTIKKIFWKNGDEIV